MRDPDILRSSRGLLKEVPCPGCNTLCCWNGPGSGSDDAESFGCSEPRCPVTGFMFDQRDDSYSDIRVTSSLMDRWDDVEIKETFGEKYELP